MTTSARNICPACGELTDADDIETPGTFLNCSECGIELVAECFGTAASSDAEWALIRADEYSDEEVDLETASAAKPYCNICTGPLGGCNCTRDLVMDQ